MEVQPIQQQLGNELQCKFERKIQAYSVHYHFASPNCRMKVSVFKMVMYTHSNSLYLLVEAHLC